MGLTIKFNVSLAYMEKQCNINHSNVYLRILKWTEEL